MPGMNSKSVFIVSILCFVSLPLFAEAGTRLFSPGAFLRLHGPAELDRPLSDYDDGAVPELNCRAAVLLDQESGRLLYAKNPDLVIPPASMTKLVSLHLIYRAIEQGEIDLNDRFTVPAAADFRNAPPRSSLMFLQQGQEVSILELMQGLALPSGNDAARLVADTLAGSFEAYVEMMNREMERLGFESIHFVDSSGYSENNHATALEFARFCRYYLQEHPQSIEQLHNLLDFTYPKEHNLTSDEPAVYGPISQPNHNSLVGRHPWVDGLKTGYIDESGYNVALSAEYEGRRLVAVLMGGPGENSRQGDLLRIVDGANLLSYGFFRFSSMQAKGIELPSLPVLGGQEPFVQPLPIEQDEVLLLPDEYGSLNWALELPDSLTAPLSDGCRIGMAYLYSPKRIVAVYPLLLERELNTGGVFKGLVNELIRPFVNRETVPRGVVPE